MKRISLFISIILALLVVSIAVAQSGGGYDLTWNTIDGGGGTSSNGAYTLNGTIGQADAGSLSGSGYTLSGGFCVGAAAATMNYRVYLPSVLK